MYCFNKNPNRLHIIIIINIIIITVTIVVVVIPITVMWSVTSLNHSQVRRLLWHLSQLRFVFYTYVVTKNASKRLSFAIILLKLYVRPSARRPEDEMQNRKGRKNPAEAMNREL